ncbi:unnamed protein product [Cuscuta campestris]|uniref:Uncharacterized protein n=1 Tax=Cuscuta campestris TaxID=132261 RepID=A0A484N0W4_9ASTE|nr:unnamed protein product [Cuscuta campestris]
MPRATSITTLGKQLYSEPNKHHRLASMAYPHSAQGPTKKKGHEGVAPGRLRDSRGREGPANSCREGLVSSPVTISCPESNRASLWYLWKSKSKSRAPAMYSEERLYYGNGSYLWFDSEEERTRFLTFFSKQVVAPPRIVPERFPDLQGYDDLDVQLHQAGLWPFVSRAQKEINLALIRAFYYNLRREGNVLYSLVKSTPIELFVAQLGRIAGLPYQGDDVSHYGGEDWVLNNEGLILNELGITELIRHASGRPTIHSATPESRLLLSGESLERLD